MKRGLFLLATVTLSSALYAQGIMSSQKARQIVEDFNPQLLERASQDGAVSQLLEELITSYVAKQPLDNLANRYELAAIARNFDNSIDLYKTVQDYQQAVRYSLVGENIEPSALQYAQDRLRGIYARIWAVSVQDKTALLAQYKLLQDPANQDNILALKAELKQLQTNVGQQLTGLVQNTLAQAKARVLAEQAERVATSNLQIKTKHKKPVAE